jgi:hypothetical protein
MMPQLAEGTLILTIAMLSASILFMVAPFVMARRSKKRMALARAQEKRDSLIANYERIVATLRDLEEDYNTGKLDQATYERDREHWAGLGTQLLAELDVNSSVVKHSQPSASVKKKQAERSDADADAILDDAIESAIQNYVQAQSGQ